MDPLKAYAREILRWGVIATSGGCGLWLLVEAGRGFVTRRIDGWLDVLLCLIVPVMVAAPLLAIAYICLRRQYRKLFLVLGVFGGIITFAELSALPHQVGIFQLMDRLTDENPNLAFLWLPLALPWLFVPIYAAAYFFSSCRRFAYSRQNRRRGGPVGAADTPDDDSAWSLEEPPCWQRRHRVDRDPRQQPTTADTGCL